MRGVPVELQDESLGQGRRLEVQTKDIGQRESHMNGGENDEVGWSEGKQMTTEEADKEKLARNGQRRG
ncbi:hypothetical protein CVT26_007911 [Gymnopilus dilepis]|uniref:Uncharacterized protein n=1 Tax=Gymnopilus dilepis TaxID=231916 RepID=A0A409YK92_9AGAR|nr:hypothetical protein CVT26_007911 [Gymnopilus dilepis]